MKKTLSSGERGSMLIISLLLSLILLLMGICFLTVKTLQYQGGALTGRFAAASALAETGMEDARIKLEKDPEFPPPGDEDQAIFSYSEEFYDIDEVTRAGTYTVTIDSTYKDSPYKILKITSYAIVGTIDDPLAMRRITSELDISPTMRDNPAVPNPNYFKYINWQKSGSI